MSTRPLSVAVIGAGPAGIYAADILSKSDLEVQIDLFEQLPAPYGLVRYGVAPDHPRIKQIITALYRILQRGDITLLANVKIGEDLTVEDLQAHYDAIVVATGADRDAPLNIPGVELPQSYGAADFVYWYDGNPDYPRHWPLEAKSVAVLGVGNVALDVARVLAKHPEDMLVTEVPENVYRELEKNPVTDVHVFGRRGPAQVKFTPLELRELGEVPDVDVIVYEEDFDYDEGSQKAIKASNQTKMVVKTLTNYAMVPPEEHTASRRIHIHMFHSPAEILADENGNVRALKTERTQLDGNGGVTGTGEFVETEVQAVYRAIGYFSSPVKGLPFDEKRGVIPSVQGRVTDNEGEVVNGVYATGWIRRGPIGLIGSTKSDAAETISMLVEDANAGKLKATTDQVGHEAIVALLESRHVPYTTWQGWELLDAYERKLGEEFGEVPGGRGRRERVKVVSRKAMTAISRGEEIPADLIGSDGE
ncbi:pyridine nucleotide-disulfide oxidoreductase [Boudabousia tangfeifanii]|uniref:ferredoxin--NADP(+) reductase n=1 Tax=Boudabousia tangfeifanii TaxID=1912795 RepID=A0A1D9MIQ6_9ACTO|nr:FAD-dependent oxidoreductase [Boudabousia tangfeifanii]AOZ72195.1 pyridine nucleotide-disulfide oxidoreductase [Boudabousia tangfeifanii]